MVVERLRVRNLLADRFHLAFHRRIRCRCWLLRRIAGDLRGPQIRLDYEKLTCRKQSMERFAPAIPKPALLPGPTRKRLRGLKPRAG